MDDDDGVFDCFNALGAILVRRDDILRLHPVFGDSLGASRKIRYCKWTLAIYVLTPSASSAGCPFVLTDHRLISDLVLARFRTAA